MNQTKTELKIETCGIIMPISDIDNYPKNHWRDVKAIIEEVAKSAELDPKLVSEGDESHVIQNTIVENLYNNDIVVCDVSGKNPNVMFELGIRLTFDKPTIIIKDDKTSYSFDTSPVEHLQYPSDLRYSLINEFKAKLKEKIVATLLKAKKDPQYSVFIKHFGPFLVPKVETREVSKEDFILSKLEEISKEMKSLKTEIAIVKNTSIERYYAPRIPLTSEVLLSETYMPGGLSGLTSGSSIFAVRRGGDENSGEKAKT